jgi:hypothetical protein
MDRSSPKTNNMHMKKVTYCNAHVPTIQKWSRHAYSRQPQLEVGRTTAPLISINKQAVEKSMGSLCRGRSRAVTFLETSNHESNIYTIDFLFLFTMSQSVVSKASHTHTSNDTSDDSPTLKSRHKGSKPSSRLL